MPPPRTAYSTEKLHARTGLSSYRALHVPHPASPLPVCVATAAAIARHRRAHPHQQSRQTTAPAAHHHLFCALRPPPQSASSPARHAAPVCSLRGEPPAAAKSWIPLQACSNPAERMPDWSSAAPCPACAAAMRMAWPPRQLWPDPVQIFWAAAPAQLQAHAPQPLTAHCRQASAAYGCSQRTGGATTNCSARPAPACRPATTASSATANPAAMQTSWVLHH